MRTLVAPSLLLSLVASGLFGQSIITSIAGTSISGYSGDGGPATAAELNGPHQAVADASGNLYFPDAANLRIRKIDTNGIITTIAGTGTYGSTGDGGPALSASLGYIEQLAIDNAGHLCFGDEGAYKIRCINLTTGIIQGYGTGTPGYKGDGGNVANASFYDIMGAVFDNAGNLFVSDFGENVVRRVDAVTGIVTTVAGPGPGYCCAPTGDGGPATSANLYEPMGLAYSNGALYIADEGNARVRRVELSTNIITTVAGNGSYYTSGTGVAATSVSVNSRHLAADSNGNLYLDANNAIYVVTSQGILNLFAGEPGISGFCSNNVAVTQCPFSGVNGVTWDATGSRVLVSDGQYEIRQVLVNTSTVSLSSSLNPAPQNQAVTFTATISPSTATGMVQFVDGATVLGSAAVSAGSTVFSTSSLAKGTHNIAAEYSGDTTYASSVSATLSQVVQGPPTTTAVSPSANPSPVGASVTFTINVAPATATGTVQLNDGAAAIGTATLVNGAATITTSALTAGPHSIAAAYSGDSSDAPSTSAVFSETIQATSTTTVASNSNPSIDAAPVTFTATVTPASATGTVQFNDGANALGSAQLASGTASLTVTIAAGAHSITASYSGDTNTLPSTSSALQQTVKANAAITLAAAPTTATVGQTVTLTAAVTPSTATGSIQFSNGSTVLGTAAISAGQAQITTTALPVGTNSLTASYGGDQNDSSATSSVVSVTVNLVSTSTALAASVNPVLSGGTVAFTATVTPASATGTVQFLDGGTPLGTGTLGNGSAFFSTSTLSTGTHTITAVYSGDAADAGSTSAALPESVKLYAGLTIGLIPSPAVAGQTVTLSANMASAATGTVKFTDGSTVLATVPVASGVASYSTTTLAPGQHTLGVSYSGDSTYVSASGTANETVLVASSVVLQSSANPATTGQSVTFTATVTPATATGTVQFYDGAGAIGTVGVASGVARFSTTSLAPGSHSMSANYSGDSVNSPAYSPTLTETVRAATSVSLTSSANPSTTGQSVTFAAALTPATATGTVQFVDGSTVLGTANVSSGSAAFSTSQLATGAHSITALYSGDTLDAAAVSGVLSQTVNAAPPAAPSNLTATAAGASQINLAWTASTTSAVTYNVYASTSSGFVPAASNRIASGVPSTSYSATGLTASTTYYFRVTAANAAGESAATNQASAATAAVMGCHVNYSVTDQWNNGFTGAISIQNTGSATINNWRLTWTWPGNQKVTQASEAKYSENGPNVTFTNESYNATIAPGATLTGIGFNASYKGSNPAPTAFAVNGTPCR